MTGTDFMTGIELAVKEAVESQEDDLINDIAFHLGRQDAKVRAALEDYIGSGEFGESVREFIYNHLHATANDYGGNVPSIDARDEEIRATLVRVPVKVPPQIVKDHGQVRAVFKDKPGDH